MERISRVTIPEKQYVRKKHFFGAMTVLATLVALPAARSAALEHTPPKASCAPTVVSVASPVFGNLGTLFRALRATGWDIRLWPLTAQQKPESSLCDGN